LECSAIAAVVIQTKSQTEDIGFSWGKGFKCIFEGISNIRGEDIRAFTEDGSG
jgi:hypothetical protein